MIKYQPVQTQRTFLTAEWKNLLMANYTVDPAILLPHLPAGTTLDEYNGKVYLSLVGFMFCNTRLLGIRVPFHVNFEEVNLRFYVRYREGGITKRGAVFIKEIVPKPAISFIANTIYHEKYDTARMRHYFRQDGQVTEAGYHWKHRHRWNKLEVKAAPRAIPMVTGSEEEFIAEHYWGYSRYNAGTTYEYNVQHPAWRIYPVQEYNVDCDFGALYGNTFSFLTETKPSSVFLAEGSAVCILRKRRI